VLTFIQDRQRGLTWLGLALFIFLIIFLTFLFSYFVSSISTRQELGDSIPAKIERIISLNVAATEVLVELGLEDKIVGVSSSKGVPETVKGKPKAGRGFGDVNIEAVLVLRPDIVFVHKQDAQVLKEKGIPVFIVETCNLREVISLVRRIGEKTDKEREAYEIADRMENRINKIQEELGDIKFRPLVYFESGSIGRTRASGTLTHDLITLAGGENLAKDEPVSFPLLSNEYIITRNPDIIIIEDYGVSIEGIKKRDGWQDIKAIKNDKVFTAPVYYTNYTPRCIEGLEQFAWWFHSEIFE